MMPPTESILLAVAPVLGGWIWRTEQRISKMDGVIEKMDELVSLLLEDRLDSRAAPTTGRESQADYRRDEITRVPDEGHSGRPHR